MGMGHVEIEFLLHEHAYRPIEGEVLAIGRQHIGLTAVEITNMIERYGIPLRSQNFEIDNNNLHKVDGNESVSDVSFFRSFSEATYLTADISAYEGAEFIFDICGEVPSDLVGRFDFIIDGRSLDNVFDPVRMISNMAKMLKPGGRLFVFAWSNSFPSAYLKITPDWIMDYFAVNEFEDAKVYVTKNDTPWDEPAFGQCVDVYHFDPLIFDGSEYHYESAAIKMTGYGSTYCIAEKGRQSEHGRTAVQKHYRDRNVEPYLSSIRRFHESHRPIFSRPGEPSPVADVISDMPTVRPIARFGVPAVVPIEKILMSKFERAAVHIERSNNILIDELRYQTKNLNNGMIDQFSNLIRASHLGLVEQITQQITQLIRASHLGLVEQITQHFTNLVRASHSGLTRAISDASFGSFLKRNFRRIVRRD